MKKSVVIASIAFVVLVTLHHDFWNWGDTTLVFGFIPVGLAYHVGYSVAAGIFWYLVARFAWPHAIETWAGEAND